LLFSSTHPRISWLNYDSGQQGELSACHNDANNVKDYLIKACGFKESEMLILMDDGKHTMPTKKNIEDAFTRMTQYSQPGDVVFVSFSGHGGRIEDTSGKFSCREQSSK